jgi:hypothetical protein
MVAPYNIRLGAGITIGSGITVGGAGSPSVDPATNTGGISLAVIAGLPQNLYPGVSLYGDIPATAGTKFIVNSTDIYGKPAGFTFLSSWYWAQYDPAYITVTSTNAADDTIAAIFPSYCNNGALGSVVIAPSSKVMFSVNHSIWSGYAADGVGVGSATTDYIGQPNKYLGNDNQSLGIYNDGSVYFNSNSVASGYAVFETNGQIIDVAVDTVNNKMWYRVAGGAWQG